MDQQAKMPNPDFVVRLVGPGLKPWVVPLRSLARVLEAVQRLIEQKEDDSPDDDNTPDTKVAATLQDGRVLKLLGIKSTSAAYSVSSPSPELALDVLSITGSAINDPAHAEWTPATISSLKELSETARSLGCKIEFRTPSHGRTLGDVIAVIGPLTYDLITDHAFITGQTSVYGKIERVGGATEMHCGLRLPDRPRKMVICRVVGADLVRELGRYMYQYIVVSGMATWVRHNKQLKTLEINSYEQPKTGSILEVLDEVYAAGGDAWDKIDDPDAYIAELRGS